MRSVDRIWEKVKEEVMFDDLVCTVFLQNRQVVWFIIAAGSRLNS